MEEMKGNLTRELSEEELLNRDYYQGRFVSKVRGKEIFNWDTSNVTDMSYMFSNNKEFNQDINTKEVTIGNKKYIAWDILNVQNI